MEELLIGDYRLALFTVFNMAALQQGMGGFRFQTDEEEIEELDQYIEHFSKMGIWGHG